MDNHDKNKRKTSRKFLKFTISSVVALMLFASSFQTFSALEEPLPEVTEAVVAQEQEQPESQPESIAESIPASSSESIPASSTSNSEPAQSESQSKSDSNLAASSSILEDALLENEAIISPFGEIIIDKPMGLRGIEENPNSPYYGEVIYDFTYDGYVVKTVTTEAQLHAILTQNPKVTVKNEVTGKNETVIIEDWEVPTGKVYIQLAADLTLPLRNRNISKQITELVIDGMGMYSIRDNSQGNYDYNYTFHASHKMDRMEAKRVNISWFNIYGFYCEHDNQKGVVIFDNVNFIGRLLSWSKWSQIYIHDSYIEVTKQSRFANEDSVADKSKDVYAGDRIVQANHLYLSGSTTLNQHDTNAGSAGLLAVHLHKYGDLPNGRLDIARNANINVTAIQRQDSNSSFIHDALPWDFVIHENANFDLHTGTSFEYDHCGFHLRNFDLRKNATFNVKLDNLWKNVPGHIGASGVFNIGEGSSFVFTSNKDRAISGFPANEVRPGIFLYKNATLNINNPKLLLLQGKTIGAPFSTNGTATVNISAQQMTSWAFNYQQNNSLPVLGNNNYTQRWVAGTASAPSNAADAVFTMSGTLKVNDVKLDTQANIYTVKANSSYTSSKTLKLDTAATNTFSIGREQ